MSNGKPVVLAGDGDGPVLQVDHGLIRTTVPVAHFVGLQARSEAHQLMAEANAHHGHAIGNSTCEGVSCISGLAGVCWITGPVAAEERIDVEGRLQVFVGSVGWAPHDVKEHAEMSQDVVFHAAIKNTKTGFSCTELVGGTWVQFNRCIDGDFIDEIFQIRGRHGGELFFHGGFLVHRSKDAKHGSKFSNALGDGACVDVMNTGHSVKSQKFIDGSCRMAMVGLMHSVAHDHPSRPNMSRLRCPNMNAIIANERIGEGQDLPCE